MRGSKFQIPSTKRQINSKKQNPNPKQIPIPKFHNTRTCPEGDEPVLLL
jgi:hypothetical protein